MPAEPYTDTTLAEQLAEVLSELLDRQGYGAWINTDPKMLAEVTDPLLGWLATEGHLIPEGSNIREEWGIDWGPDSPYAHRWDWYQTRGQAERDIAAAIAAFGPVGALHRRRNVRTVPEPVTEETRDAD